MFRTSTESKPPPPAPGYNSITVRFKTVLFFLFLYVKCWLSGYIVFDEILNLIESVSECFSTYSYIVSSNLVT